MTLRRYRPLALLLLVLHLQACASWGVSPLSPSVFAESAEESHAKLLKLIDEQQLSSIRITKPDGTRVVVQEPRIENDSIFGVSEECGPSFAAGGRVVCTTETTALASLGDISRVEVEHWDPLKTLGAVIVLPVAVFALFMVVVCSGGDGGGIGSPCG